jgi:hypothetical protein
MHAFGPLHCAVLTKDILPLSPIPHYFSHWSLLLSFVFASARRVEVERIW